MLTIGDLAPDFELISDEGNPIKLSALRGNRVVLFFYPKATTPGCTKQACGFRDNYTAVQQAGAVVLGLSPDSPAKLAKWRQEHGFPYNLLADEDHAVAEAYGVWGEKKFMGKTFLGIIRSHFVIDEEGRLADVQIKVSPEDSVALALNFLEL
jgi:peroxiredoxin Q/BCP